MKLRCEVRISATHVLVVLKIGCWVLHLRPCAPFPIHPYPFSHPNNPWDLIDFMGTVCFYHWQYQIKRGTQPLRSIFCPAWPRSRVYLLPAGDEKSHVVGLGTVFGNQLLKAKSWQEKMLSFSNKRIWAVRYAQNRSYVMQLTNCSTGKESNCFVVAPCTLHHIYHCPCKKIREWALQ